MESNTTQEQYFSNELPLVEPHFDEEATLLSAQPVVPLQQIKSEERARRGLILGAIIACSLAVGGLGAAFIYKRSGQESSTAIVSKAAPGAAGISPDEPVAAVAEAVGGGAAGMSPESVTAPEPTKSVPPVSHRAVATVVDTKRKRPLPPQVQERDLTRAEPIDEWRLRRRSEREAWRESRRRQRRSDELLRIRDIFEGPSRP